jgi:hypothetical protein
MQADWFWATIVRGYIEPWHAEADQQNRTVVRAYLAAAATMAAGGYLVVLDAILGPWFLDVVEEECHQRAIEFVYVVVRPRLDIAVARAGARFGETYAPGHLALTDSDVVRRLWELFRDLGPHEDALLDNSELDSGETAERIVERVRAAGLG